MVICIIAGMFPAVAFSQDADVKVLAKPPEALEFHSAVKAQDVVYFFSIDLDKQIKLDLKTGKYSEFIYNYQMGDDFKAFALSDEEALIVDGQLFAYSYKSGKRRALIDVKLSNPGCLNLNDKVFIYGGMENKQISKKWFLIDAKGAVLKKGNLNHGRYEASAVKVSDDTIIVSGGIKFFGKKNEMHNSIETVNLKTAKASIHSTSLLNARRKHLSFYHKNKVIFLGGDNNHKASVIETLDLKTGKIENTNSLFIKRHSIQAHMNQSGKIFIYGGQDNCRMMEVYDVENTAIFPVKSMLKSAHSLGTAVVQLSDDKVLISGGVKNFNHETAGMIVEEVTFKNYNGLKIVTESIKELIEQLGARKFKDRMKARKRLLAMGDQIKPILKRLLTSDDPELRLTAKELLEHFQVQKITTKVYVSFYLDSGAERNYEFLLTKTPGIYKNISSEMYRELSGEINGKVKKIGLSFQEGTPLPVKAKVFNSLGWLKFDKIILEN